MNSKILPNHDAPNPPSERGNFPARLHVLLARDAKVGLVIRRGPSKSVCTVLWNRERKTFKLGQWIRGRIYERRCDLSPDGRHFIYFAMNGRWDSETKGAWTAISHVPYLKAINLFAKGDCWHGGGLFLSDREFWLNDAHGHTELKKSSQLRRNPNGQARNPRASSRFPYSVVYIRFNWADVEPERGNYNWRVIDDVIAAWKPHGATVVFRVMTCNAHSAGYYASPKWLFDSGCKGFEYFVGGDDAADVLRYLVATRARSITQRKLRGV